MTIGLSPVTTLTIQLGPQQIIGQTPPWPAAHLAGPLRHGGGAAVERDCAARWG